MTKKQIRFTVRKKGGKSSGETLEHDVPAFDWGEFKNSPNAETFVKKAYFSAAQKIVREIHESKNGTEEYHLKTIESLVARSINFNSSEINDWLESRDWEQAKFTIEKSKGINFLKKNLPLLASDDSSFPEKLRDRAAELIAEIADIEADPVADYLWVKLTQESSPGDLLLSL
jgi:hypothetical protein